MMVVSKEIEDALTPTPAGDLYLAAQARGVTCMCRKGVQQNYGVFRLMVHI